MSDNNNGSRILRVTRRDFLVGAAALALTGAGCGGGGGSSEDYRGTYRAEFSATDTAAAVTVDRDGRLTFWTRYIDESDELYADFGQTTLFDENRFSQVEEGVRTTARIDGSTVFGRSEQENNRNNGFNWEAFQVRRPSGSAPRSAYVGRFSGSVRRENIDVDVLLQIDEDGNATFFGAFDDLDEGSASDPAEFYAFESLSFDRNGSGYSYFFDFDGNRMRVDETGSSDLRLYYTFSDDFIDLEGVTFEIDLFRNNSRSVDIPRPSRLAGRTTRAAASRGKLRRK